MTGKGAVKKGDYIICGALILAAWLLFMHVDLMETANHAYVFLESLFDGRAADFYNVVSAHENIYYYINNAHYNIAVYLLFGLWELPVFIFNAVFSLPLNEGFLWLWAKGLCVAAFVACVFLVKKIAAACEVEDAGLAALAFALNPIALFMPAAVGQYDVLCAVFVLWSLLYYKNGDTLRFCAVMGAAVLMKSFALLALLPLLLYREKKLFSIIKYAAVALLPYAATSLLYRGRTGDAEWFNNIMSGRLFSTTVGLVPIFPVLLAVLCAVCWLRDFPEKEAERASSAARICLAVFGVLMLTVYWHPQWIFLVMPFFVLAAFTAKNKTLYLYLNLLLSAGVFLYAWNVFSGQFERNMLYYGALYLFGNSDMINAAYRPMAGYMEGSPMLGHIASALVYCALAALLACYLPLFGGKQLADARAQQPEDMKLCVYVTFALSICFWLLCFVTI